MRGRGMIPPVLFLALAVPLCAIEWPVQKKIVTGNFGESRGDHFHTGIDIGGGEQEVRPILDGELVFRYDEESDYSSLPRGVGSFAVLRHKENILSIYCHLKNGSVPADKKSFSDRDLLGIIGETGDSEGKHLHLEIYDLETKAFLNPLSILPPIPDRQPPVIKGVFLKSGGSMIPLESGSEAPRGQGEIYAEIYDLREDVRYLWTMAPYSVRMALNGKEVSKIVLDSLQVKNGRMVVAGTSLDAARMYASDRLIECGSVELRGGESHLHIVVRDFAGNETVKEFFFKIKE
jgi:hypothetical protein